MPKNGKTPEARNDAPELVRMREQAEAVEKAADEAIARGDLDEADRIADGHPDAAGTIAIRDRIAAARADASAAPDAGDDLPLEGDEPEDAPSYRAFFLNRARAKVVHLNVRAERHGNDEVTCIDVKIETNLAATALSMFDEALRPLLFWKSGDPLDLADATNDAPNLRFPDLAPLKWKRDLVGAGATVHYGIDDRSAIVLDGAVVTDFELAPKEGGTVVVTFKVKAKRPSETAIGRLGLLVKREVDVTIAPPDVGWHVEPDPDDEEEEE